MTLVLNQDEALDLALELMSNVSAFWLSQQTEKLAKIDQVLRIARAIPTEVQS